MSWTDERVETLKKMWGEGQSASQIAKELGGVTRNAVIGKVHRLGLSNRTTTGAAKPDAKPKVVKAEPKPKAAPKVEAAPKPSAPVTDVVTTAPPPRSAARRAIIPAGQPLPPQPSANEISPEALA
ncbi:MAG: GcrA family cell cycle regulator, partial [Planktotalea arctica]